MTKITDIQALFNATTHLPVLPEVVDDLLRLLADDDPDFRAVISKISRDPVIAAKVLRLANTAHYGSARQIKTLDEAVGMIGSARLVTLVIALGVTEAMINVPGINLHQFWRQSFVTAAVARQIAIDLNHQTHSEYQPELVYLGGLLHRIGQLVMHLFFPDAWYAFEKVSFALNGAERKVIEQAQLGVDHCQVGQALTKRWLLPVEIQRMVGFYLSPQHHEADQHAQIVHLAEHIASSMVQAISADQIVKSANNSLITLLAPDETACIEKIESYSVLMAEADAFI